MNIIEYGKKNLELFFESATLLPVSKPRSPGQALIAVALDEQLLAAIDRKRGTTNRSQFIRESLAKFLGISINLAAAPDRTGKGGRPKNSQPSLKVAVKTIMYLQTNTKDNEP